ncbi:MAG TPA: CBS domain-containing protein [Bacteroidales bacterium]|nr:CBS domain-containing protein [Bacteroidales bacterium]
MIAKELVSDGIIPLKTSDTGRMALSWMEDLRLLHLPIVNAETFLGVVSEIDIFSHNNFDEPVGNMELSLSAAYVLSTDHLFDVLRLMHEQQLSLVPVVDEDHKYLGSITMQKLLGALTEAYSFSEPGSIIVIEMSANDFVLSTLARIFEDNDTKIISLFLRTDNESTRLEVNLKTNRIETGPLLQALNRFNYQVLGVYSSNPDADDLKERFEAFMKYMNI